MDVQDNMPGCIVGAWALSGRGDSLGGGSRKERATWVKGLFSCTVTPESWNMDVGSFVLVLLLSLVLGLGDG